MKTMVACLISSIATAVIFSLYLLLSHPWWWYEEIKLRNYDVEEDIKIPVYSAYGQEKLLFTLHQGDKCYWLDNNGRNFGDPDPKDGYFRKMLIICPEKGVGWIG